MIFTEFIISILEQKLYKRNTEFHTVKVEISPEIKGKTDEVHIKILCFRGKKGKNLARLKC